VCLLTATSTSFAVELLAGLEVDVVGMRRNLDGYTGSERVLGILTERLGKHAAQEALQVALGQGRRTGRSMPAALVDAGLLSEQEVAALEPDAGAAGAMVDLVLARARAARAAEDEA
jgi:adenylosuccinate lyase